MSIAEVHIVFYHQKEKQAVNLFIKAILISFGEHKMHKIQSAH